MAKFCGKIGFAKDEETAPGVWTKAFEEREYRGDFGRISRLSQSSGQVNDNISLANEISIIADSYAQQNFGIMRYVILGGAKWKINKVEVQHPRVILTVGGFYNGG